MKGKLIAIEGVDRSGKETQSKLLYEYLNTTDRPCKIYHFPRYETPTGKLIHSALRRECSISEKIKLFADDRLAARDEILEDINNGYHVVCDRYLTSMVVYTLAEIHYLLDNDKKTIVRMQNQFVAAILRKELMDNKMPKLDLELILRINPKLALKNTITRKNVDNNEKNYQLQELCYYYYDMIHNNTDFLTIASNREVIECVTDEYTLKPIFKIHELVKNTTNGTLFQPG